MSDKTERPIMPPRHYRKNTGNEDRSRLDLTAALGSPRRLCDSDLGLGEDGADTADSFRRSYEGETPTSLNGLF